MILVVEDNPHLRSLWVSVLVRAGHAARGASSGGEAIAAAIEVLPDLVVMDLDLPDMSGFDLIAELLPLGSFPIVALTGASDLGTLAHLGFAETHLKPISTTEMVAIADRHLPKTPPKGRPMTTFRIIALFAACSLTPVLACGGPDTFDRDVTATSSTSSALGAVANGAPGGGFSWCCFHPGTNTLWHVGEVAPDGTVLTSSNINGMCATGRIPDRRVCG